MPYSSLNPLLTVFILNILSKKLKTKPYFDMVVVCAYIWPFQCDLLFNSKFSIQFKILFIKPPPQGLNIIWIPLVKFKFYTFSQISFVI